MQLTIVSDFVKPRMYWFLENQLLIFQPNLFEAAYFMISEWMTPIYIKMCTLFRILQISPKCSFTRIAWPRNGTSIKLRNKLL